MPHDARESGAGGLKADYGVRRNRLRLPLPKGAFDVPVTTPTLPRTKSAVQMRDVAGIAGVSITTVSHIVNETRAVAPHTRERVLRAMRELKFHRNAYRSEEHTSELQSL